MATSGALAFDTTRSVRAGAPHTSSTARASPAGRSPGSTAAMDRPNRIACPAHGTCSDAPVPAGQAVGDGQRGQAERDQGGDPVPGGQAERRVRARLVDHPGQHPAGPGHRVLHLAPVSDNLQHRGPHRLRAAAGSLPQLAERRGIQIQPLHPHPDLVRPDGRAVVQLPGRLRQHTGGLDHPVQAERGPAWVALTRSSHRKSSCREPTKHYLLLLGVRMGGYRSANVIPKRRWS